MHLMPLGKQSKKSLMMAQEYLDTFSGKSSSARPPAVRAVPLLPTSSAIPYDSRPIEPIWNPPLGERYFNMIRSFFIKLEVPCSVRPQSANVLNRLSEAATNSIHYDFCDSLHKLIGRLRLIPRPIAHLGIIIKFRYPCAELNEAFSTMKLLLKPLRRLHNVVKLEVLSIRVKNLQNQERELLTSDGIFHPADSIFVDDVKCWSSDISRSKSSTECPQVFEAYWQLEKLLSSVKEHYHSTNPKFSQINILLLVARIAREAEDLTSFKEIWDQVVNIWFDHLNPQIDFQSNVARSIDAIYGIVGN